MNKNTKAVEVANETSEFPVCDPSQGERLAVIMKENIGSDGGINLLDRIVMPSGKTSTYQIPGMEGDISSKEIIAVIGVFKDHRTYFEKSYDETGGNEKPTCLSDDMENGIGNPGGECQACPLNQFESAKKGGGKACIEKRLLMIFLPSKFLPVKLDAPPTSLLNIRKYFLRLASEGKLYRHVVTKFILEQDKNDTGLVFSKIVPSFVRDLTAEEKSGIDNYVEGLKKGSQKDV